MIEEDLDRCAPERGTGELTAIKALRVFIPRVHAAVNPESRRRE